MHRHGGSFGKCLDIIECSNIHVMHLLGAVLFTVSDVYFCISRCARGTCSTWSNLDTPSTRGECMIISCICSSICLLLPLNLLDAPSSMLCYVM